MSEHTPTPWAVDPDHRIGMEWNTHIVLADNPDHRVCFMTSGPEGPINAAFIVRAVNNHDALVKFLKILLAHDDRFQVAVGGNPRIVDAMLAEGRALLGAVGSPVLTHEKGPGL